MNNNYSWSLINPSFATSHWVWSIKKCILFTMSNYLRGLGGLGGGDTGKKHKLSSVNVTVSVCWTDGESDGVFGKTLSVEHSSLCWKLLGSLSEGSWELSLLFTNSIWSCVLSLKVLGGTSGGVGERSTFDPSSNVEGICDWSVYYDRWWLPSTSNAVLLTYVLNGSIEYLFCQLQKSNILECVCHLLPGDWSLMVL